MEWICNHLNELDFISESILKACPDTTKFILSGEMGVGKTTLVKSLCRQLGVVDVVKSPTFSIVNEYMIEDDKFVYHFDFYRLKDESEAYDIGYESYFFSNHYCFVEWPSKVQNIIPKHFNKIEITNVNGSRIIKVLI